MLRTHWMTSSAAAKNYFTQSDYYASCPGDWLGKGAERLGLAGAANQMHFFALADNLDPRTGEQLTAVHRDNRRVGMDLTFNSTKSVGIARELAGPGNAGDSRIEAAHHEAVAYAMGFVERDMQTRVRIGGADDDRATGNLVAYRVTHRDTRINADDQRPDMSLHDHVFVFNATYDPVEQRWKAAQMGQIKHDAPYYEAIYHNRLAHNLKELGYGIRRSGKAFEIEGVSRELIDKFSRRSKHIEEVAAKLGIKKAQSKEKLGATTRLGKAKELADDLNAYYVGRLTEKEREQLATLEGKPSYECASEKAVGYAIDHEFYRQSVVEERKLYETALRHGIGAVTPEAVIEESRRQGVLLRDHQATTRDVLAEESRIIDFAREGRGTMRPLAASGIGNTGTLSPEQQALVSHVLSSSDQTVLVIGDAGTGKTRSVRSAFEQIHCPVEMLAPSADASRGVLRGEGFSKADTVASFLRDDDRQAAVKNGVLWVDEAGLLPIRDLSQLVEIARQQNARIVLQGDPKQHRSPARHGNMMHVLQEYAGLPVGRLTEIWRQQHQGYKAVVAEIAKGNRGKAFDRLAGLGWVKETETHKPLVDDYLEALATKKPGQKDSDRVLIVVPTHLEGQEITLTLRQALQEQGKLGEERVIETLTPLHWTDAEKGDVERYDGTEVLQFHRNSGTFKAGDQVEVTKWQPGDRFKSPSHFSVYSKGEISLAASDVIRITHNGLTADGKHRLNNGAVYQLKGFDQDGNLVLENGWTVAKDFRHVTHGYVTTSYAAQGKTVDRVLIAMGGESRGAINAEQFYVSVSRGRESAKVYTDLDVGALKAAIERTDTRKSATELMRPKRITRKKKFLEWARDNYEALPGRFRDVTRDRHAEREVTHCR